MKAAATSPASGKVVRAALQQIRANLRSCALTPAKEKAALGRCLRKVADKTRGSADSAESLRLISSELTDAAKARGLFFRGPEFKMSISSGLHAKPLVRFEAIIQRHLADAIDFDSARNLTLEVCLELQAIAPRARINDPLVWAIPLHEHGTPFWVGDASSAAPPVDVDISTYPDRAGLAPLVGQYVLVQVRRDTARIPRFADSTGYVYWRPGGKTLPIPKCPPGLSGLKEGVVDLVRVKDLSVPIETFERKGLA